MKLMTMLLGISLLSAPAMFGATTSRKVIKKKPTPEAAKAAQAAKAKTQSAAEQKAQK